MDNTFDRVGARLAANARRREAAARASSGRDARPVPQFPLVVPLVALLDTAVVAASPLAAATLSETAPHAHVLARIVVVLCVMTLAFLIGAGGYHSSVMFRRREQVFVALRGGICAFLATALASELLLGPANIDPQWLTMAGALTVLALIASRVAVARIMTHGPGRCFAPRTVIIGAGLGGIRLLRMLRQRDEASLRVVGLVDDLPPAAAARPHNVPVLGGIDDALRLVRDGDVDQVMLALPWSDEARVADLTETLSAYPVHVRVAPDLLTYRFPRRVRTDLHGFPVLHVQEPPICGWRAVVKRTEDVLIASVLLAVCALPMMVIALLVRLDSPGPALFRQPRTGFGNREFEMLKFRTMFQHAAEPRIIAQTQRNDPRVTRLGAILRRTSLDELPQILNVLRGEMSIVGPRPHAPGTLAGGRPFEHVADRYAARHRVRPGLTGLAQVRGYRGETRTEERLVLRVQSDLEYIDSWSLWLDLTILLRTAIIVLRMKNAY